MEVGSRYGPESKKTSRIKTICNSLIKKWLLSWFHSPDSPLGLRGEGLRLVVGGGGGDDLVSVLVDGAGLRGGELRLFFGLLFNLGDLLPLL